MATVMVHCVTGHEMVVPDELVALYQSWGHAVKQPVEQPKKRAPRKRAAKKEV
jgi:hypothetical protein